jgi:hypothetical protein
VGFLQSVYCLLLKEYIDCEGVGNGCWSKLEVKEEERFIKEPRSTEHLYNQGKSLLLEQGFGQSFS